MNHFRRQPSLFSALILASSAFYLAPDKDDSGGASPKGGKGGSLEDRLTAATKAATDAQSALKTAQDELASMTKSRDDLRAEVSSLQTQFESATKAATDAQGSLKTAQDQLAKVTQERDAAQGTLKTASENVTRLETLCGVKGIDPKAAPSELNNTSNGSSIYDEWQRLKGTDSGAAMAYFRQHKDELRAYAASQH